MRRRSRRRAREHRRRHLHRRPPPRRWPTVGDDNPASRAANASSPPRKMRPGVLPVHISAHISGLSGGSGVRGRGGGGPTSHRERSACARCTRTSPRRCRAREGPPCTGRTLRRRDSRAVTSTAGSRTPAASRSRRAGVGDLHRGRVGDPTRGQEATPVPHTVVEVQLSEPGDGVEVRVHAREAQIESTLGLPPAEVADAERIEDAGSQVVDDRFTGEALQDRGERQHRRLVVGEQRARLGVGRDREETVHGVGRIDRRCFHEGFAVVPRRHRRDVADPHPASRVRGVVVEQLREMVAHQVVERQPTLPDLQPECRAGERLAQRIHEAAAVAGVWRPVALDDPVSVPLDDQPMRFDPGITFDDVEECGDPLGSDPLRRRAGDVHIALWPTGPQAAEPSDSAGSDVTPGGVDTCVTTLTSWVSSGCIRSALSLDRQRRPSGANSSSTCSISWMPSHHSHDGAGRADVRGVA